MNYAVEIKSLAACWLAMECHVSMISLLSRPNRLEIPMTMPAMTVLILGSVGDGKNALDNSKIRSDQGDLIYLRQRLKAKNLRRIMRILHEKE